MLSLFTYNIRLTFVPINSFMAKHALFFAFAFCFWQLKAQDTLIENHLPAEFKSLEKYNNPVVFKYDSVTVYAICTGYISTQHKFPEPVFVWLIKTPAGNYLVDAGLAPNIADPNYFKGISKGFFDKQFTFYLYKSNYLPNQLKTLGVDEGNLRAIILSHAHFDHIGYLSYYKKTKVVITSKEKNEVERAGQLAGYQKDASKLIDFKRAEIIGIGNKESEKLAKDMLYIRTDVHTSGHAMVLLYAGKEKVLFTGDINLNISDKKDGLYTFIDKTYQINSLKQLFNHDQNLSPNQPK